MPSRTDGRMIPVAGIYRWQPDGSCKTESLYKEADFIELREMLVRLEGPMMQDRCAWCAETEHSAEDCEYAALLDRIR